MKKEQDLWVCSPSPAGVVPVVVEMLGASGMTFDGFVKCLILVIWQLEKTKILVGVEWQGEVNSENLSIVFRSRIKGQSQDIPPFPSNWLKIFVPGSLIQVIDEGIWDLLYSESLDRSGEHLIDQGWQVLAEGLEAICCKNYSLQLEVHRLTNELLLTNQGVLALTEETELLLHQQGIQVIKNGSLLEEKVRTNKELVDRLKEKEYELRQTERLAVVGRLVAGVAHEINNPLTFINVNNELFNKYLANTLETDKSQTELSEELRRAVDGIFRGVERIASIVKGLKYFSRRERAPKSEVAILQCIEDAWLLVSSDRQRLAETKLIINISSELKVYGNRQQLEQIMVNLQDNAIVAINKAAHRKGRIKISAFADTVRVGNVVITISDNGCGINSAALPKVFQPFYTNSTMGTGLGLSIVQGIVKEHGGNITLTSEVGRGTSFEISLPTDGENARQWQASM